MARDEEARGAPLPGPWTGSWNRGFYQAVRPWRSPGRLEFSWVIPWVSLAVTWGRACDKDVHVSHGEGAPSAGGQIVS